MAVIDGLGFGEEATAAASIASTTLMDFAREPIIPLVLRCHSNLRSTPGVVMSIACFDVLTNTLTWLSVGTVEGVLVHATQSSPPSLKFLSRQGGILGSFLPNLRASSVSVQRGALLIFATDGVRGNFLETVDLSESCQRIADQILAGYAKSSALVLVARYLGPSPRKRSMLSSTRAGDFPCPH